MGMDSNSHICLSWRSLYHVPRQSLEQMMSLLYKEHSPDRLSHSAWEHEETIQILSLQILQILQMPRILQILQMPQILQLLQMPQILQMPQVLQVL